MLNAVVANQCLFPLYSPYCVICPHRYSTGCAEKDHRSFQPATSRYFPLGHPLEAIEKGSRRLHTQITVDCLLILRNGNDC